MEPAKIKLLEDDLGHTFKDRRELFRALTHPTFAKEEKERKNGSRDCPHQETYATLGDAILKAGFVMLLMERGVKTKGDITIIKSDLEKNLKLAEVGTRLKLLENSLIYHRMGVGDQLKNGENKLYSDTVEALIGAIFIDTGCSFTETKVCISKIFGPEIRRMVRGEK